jgi:hypothetical protein
MGGATTMLYRCLQLREPLRIGDKLLVQDQQAYQALPPNVLGEDLPSLGALAKLFDQPIVLG